MKQRKCACGAATAKAEAVVAGNPRFAKVRPLENDQLGGEI